MRRLFIIRKDLHLSPGKLAAMVGHCAEAYWTHLLKQGSIDHLVNQKGEQIAYMTAAVSEDILEKYINGAFTKTVCEAKNLNKLKKAEEIAKELGLKEYSDYGYINDNCLTELTPENEDGTTTVGIWFKPLDDEVAHMISKKFHLYMG